jgi:spore maturation protein CgeB
MRIVVFGLSVSSTWGNGHATLWRALIDALVAEGHRVTFFERDLPFYRPHRDLDRIEGGRLVIYADWGDVAADARHAVAEADAAIVTSYCPDALAATALVADSRVPVKAFYDLDSPVTLDRLAAGEDVAWVGPDGYRPFDVVLSYAGGPALAALRDRLGARRVVPLYGSVDPARYAPGRRDGTLLSEFSYIGTYAADRQDRLARLFLEPARRLRSRRFLIAGAQYPQDFPWAPNIFFVGHLPQSMHPDFYASGRLTLNITRGAMAAVGWCPSGRLFEAAASGAAILSDDWPGLAHFFKPGEEILVADTSTEACAAIESDDAALARLGAAARERALAEHTARHRALELVAALGGAAQDDALQVCAALDDAPQNGAAQDGAPHEGAAVLETGAA